VNMAKLQDRAEFWRDIPGSLVYQISNCGNVRKKIQDGKFKNIKTYCAKGKWMMVKVKKNNIYKEFCVHRLVAEAFLKPPENNNMVVYHKNELIRDNHVDNLEWITLKELGKKSGAIQRSIPVIQLDTKTGEIINFYKSIAAAARDNYVHKETICQVIRGKLKTAAGYRWKKESFEFEK